MALILEIRDARGNLTMHRLNSLPMTIGRSLASDVIIDDPHVDARHVRLDPSADGGIEIVDVGSLNGLREDGVRVNGPRAVVAGSLLTMGKTSLLFRDADEAVAPALPLDVPRPASPMVVAPLKPSIASYYEEWLMRVVTSRSRRLTVVCVAVAAVSLNAWLGNTDSSAGSTVFAAGLAMLSGATIWSAIWAVVERGTDRRIHFASHMAVVCLALLTLMLWSEINDWLAFFFPDARVLPLLFLGVLLCTTAALVAGHLFVANALTTRGRWRIGLTVSGTFLALALVGAVLNDDKFSDVPKFANELKPLSPRLIPSTAVKGLSLDVKELKDQVDKLSEKVVAP